MPEGVVKSYDQEKHSGIIETEQMEELPVHRSALLEAAANGLYPGDLVSFKIGRNRFGKRAALEVRRIGWEEDGGGDDEAPREWQF